MIANSDAEIFELNKINYAKQGTNYGPIVLFVRETMYRTGSASPLRESQPEYEPHGF
jgi:hypothetical protein